MVWLDIFSKVPVAMTIAGSDSGGGAGIEADLKTFAALGVHGTVALTSITAQNTREVRAVQDVEVDVIRAQIDAVVEDIGVDAAKTGMLHTSEIIEAVAERISHYGIPLVVDPVMIAKSGAPLLKPEARETLIKVLLPLAKVVTPNAREAEAISGIRIENLEDARKAAKLIAEHGPEAVIVKGGHLSGPESVDVLYHEGRYLELSAPRVDTRNTHGTGCSFSAAMTAELAKGSSVEEAFKIAKEIVTSAIRFGIPLGSGHGPLNPMARLYNESERYRTWKRVYDAVKLLESLNAGSLTPEVGMNVAMSLPYSTDPEDVVAVPGRLRRVGSRVIAAAPPEFGASSHLARYILTARRYDPRIRAALNMAFDEETLKELEGMGLTISHYDRREEPPEVKGREGSSVPWGVEQAIRRVGRVPDVIYHRGDWGKEPMIVLLGEDPLKLARIVERLVGKDGR